MRAGLLTERIEIWRIYDVTDTYGANIPVWDMVGSTRARIVNDGGSRDIENNEVVFPYIKKVEVRQYVDITENDRIKWNGRFWRVLDIYPNKDNMTKEIRVEVVND